MTYVFSRFTKHSSISNPVEFFKARGVIESVADIYLDGTPNEVHEFKRKVGGNITVINKDTYRWYLEGTKAQAFLCQIYAQK